MGWQTILGLAYSNFWGYIVEKYFKELSVGRAKVILSANIIIQDNRGRRIPQTCGILWYAQECEFRTIGAENSVAIEGDPGPGISIEVFEVSLRERRIIKRLPPTFSRTNTAEKIWVWNYEQAIAVFISGKEHQENWTVSHWRMLSGRIDFDVAKDKICALEIQATDNGNGHGDKPQIAEPAQAT
jgi:hypothetical protein